MIDPISSSLFRSTPAPFETQAAPFVGNLAPMTPQPTLPNDFASLLSGMISDTATTVKAAEATALSEVHGKASIQQVAEAVLAAEMTLQGAIAVRDKITAAYLELSRMAI
jgi:flagellar hook-basal body complex protein FliE